MKKESGQKIQLRPEEIGRQAISSLKGYIYQIYQSLAAWLDLKENEILFLEVAEDYAVLADNALTAVQVKDTAVSRSVTLNSPSIRLAIQSFWNFQIDNPNKTVQFRYLTTSPIGRERSLRFPDNLPGLLYWRTAAREGADVEPIRSALLVAKLSKDFKDFIRSASGVEFQDGLLRRIKWDCGAEDISSLDQTIRDRLVYVGERQNLPPSDSERARGV